MIKLTLKQISDLIDSVIDTKVFLYDLHVTTPPKDLIRQRHQDSVINGKESEINKEYKLTSKCNSVIVWSIFTKVAADYFYKTKYLPEILDKLNQKFNQYNINFGYDDYNLNRKQFAVISGAGKISKTSIVFSEKFGLNVKFDLIFTNAVFDEYNNLSDKLLYENCAGCDAPCQSRCPQECRMDYALIDWEKCLNFIDHEFLFEHPDQMCRLCIESCPYSNAILETIDEKYGKHMNPKFNYLN